MAFFDTAVPPDDAPGGWHGGGATLPRAHIDSLDWAVPVLSAAIQRVDEVARDTFGSAFANLSTSERTQVLMDTLQSERRSAADNAEREDRPIDTVIELTDQALYGGAREPAGWQLTGFMPAPAIEPDPFPHIQPGSLEPEYEVIVIGAAAGAGGGGGGIAAAELAAGGCFSSSAHTPSRIPSSAATTTLMP